MIDISGGVAVFVERDSPTNKLIGAGFSGRVDDAVLSEVEAHFARHRARLADAARAGCDIGIVVTQPASKSQQNVQREGFSLFYSRQLLVKSPPAQSD